MGCVGRGSHYLLDAFAELRKVLSLDAMGGGRSLLLYSLALASSFGFSFWLDGTKPLEAVLLTAIYCLVAFVLLCPLVRFVSCHGSPWKDGIFDKRLFFTVFAVVFAVYFVQFLINFPGCCSPDSDTLIRMLDGSSSLSSWSPVLHSAFVAPFVWFGRFVGDMTWGVALHSLVQMFLFSLVLAYAVSWLARRGAPCLLVLFAIVFFVLDPVMARYSITMWRDVPFSLCVLLYVLCLADIVLMKGYINAKIAFKLVFLSLGVGLFRSNGVYVVFLTLFVLTVVYRKVSLRRLLPVLIGVPIAIFVIAGPVYAAMGASSSPFRESVGIPLQQVGAVVYYDGEMTDSQEEFIQDFMSTEDIKGDYDPTTADGLKYGGHFKDEWMEENKDAFMRTWFDLGVQNPLLYLRAWLASTEGYWNANTSNWVVASSGCLGNPGESVLYEMTGIDGLNRDSQEDFQELRLTHFPTYALYSIAVSFWLALGCALFAFRRQRELVIPLVPLLSIWLTMMVAAPTYCEFRYMFALHLAIPFMIALVFAAASPPFSGMNDSSSIGFVRKPSNNKHRPD